MNILLIIYVLIALIVGSLMPFQATINNQLTKYSNHPLHSAFISFLIGSITLFILSLGTRQSFPQFKALFKVPPHLFLGGVMGASFVFFSMFFVERVGVTITVASFITGQLLMSLLIDHFGWMGVTAVPVSWQRIMGGCFLMIGLFIIVKSKN